MTKILIYGSKGWIGGLIKGYINENTNNNNPTQYELPEDLMLIDGKSRVDNVDELETEIKLVKPDHIICVIGRTHGTYNGQYIGTIDYLENPGCLFENIRDNLFCPMSLVFIAKKLNIHLTYMGTGCIFEYDESHPFGKEENGFKEESLPNFFGSSYSVVKGFTDRLMHLCEDNVLNVRIRMPITHEINKRNFITKITSYEKICSIPNSMSNLIELIPIMIDMVIKKDSGTINLVNPGLISHNEVLELYKEIVDNEFSWKNFTIEEQSAILSSGRSNNYLDTSKLEELYPDVSNIKESVRTVLELMKRQYNDE